MNGAEKLVDLLAAVCLMFFVPLLYYGSASTGLQTALVGKAGEQFLKQISVAGEITEAVVKELERELIQYGCEKYELVRLRTLYEPDEQSGLRKVEYVTDKETLYVQITEAGSSRLQKGDKIWIILYVNEVPAVYFVTVRTGRATL